MYTRNKSNRKHLMLKAGDRVEYSGGVLFYCHNWLKETGFCLQQKYFNDKVQGVVLQERSGSGPLYRIVEINGEKFDILQGQLTKIN